MRNMNSADKVDDDACHKGKSAENNVSHDIAWGMWCSFRLYGGIQFQVKTAYTCFSLLTPWVLPVGKWGIGIKYVQYTIPGKDSRPLLAA